MVRVLLLPDICQKPLHYVCIMHPFCAAEWDCARSLILKNETGLLERRWSLAVGHAGLGSGCVVRGKSGAVE